MDLKDLYAEKIAACIELDKNTIYELLEVPPNPEMGDVAFPCFTLAKQFKKSPKMIAENLQENFSLDDAFVEVKALGPYLNAFLSAKYLAENILPKAYSEGLAFGSSKVGNGKSVVVDFSSPNIAKPLGVHHLRSTMIGSSICHIHEKLGYKVIRLNYLGDWGTQFGKLIVAYQRWADEERPLGSGEEDVAFLTRLYIRFNKEAKTEPELDNEARKWFKLLEEDNEEANVLWNRFKKMSLHDFDRIYNRLHVSFDEFGGESKHSETIPKIIDICKEKELAIRSQGALVVMLDNEDHPPCMLEKTDGATTYEVRDIAALKDRYDKYGFSKMFYVVGDAQAMHFQMVFEVAEKMGLEYAKNCQHIPFGLMKFAGKIGSTREGNIVLLDEVLDEAVLKVKTLVDERDAQVKISDDDIHDIGVGSVVFGDLSSRRVKDVSLDWDEVTRFDGETGPYLQYSAARCNSIVKKSEESGFDRSLSSSEISWDRLVLDSEKRLILKLNQFSFIIVSAGENCEPSYISSYLIDLAKLLNRFVHNGKQDHSARVIQDDRGLQIARTALVKIVGDTIKAGLGLLGIQSPEYM